MNRLALSIITLCTVVLPALAGTVHEKRIKFDQGKDHTTTSGTVAGDDTIVYKLGAKDGRIFLKVVIPASTPFILVGMRIGLGSAWATLVAAELIAAQQGLGYRMQNAQLYYDLPTIFVGIVTIGVLGLVMDRILLLAEKRLTGWQERR